VIHPAQRLVATVGLGEKNPKKIGAFGMLGLLGENPPPERLGLFQLPGLLVSEGGVECLLNGLTHLWGKDYTAIVAGGNFVAGLRGGERNGVLKHTLRRFIVPGSLGFAMDA
jgi:hypothetical protein